MKKIPTLFIRLFDEHHNKTVTTEVTPGMEWVLNGEGIATVKIDGSCCAVNGGKFYKRYDAKQGKSAPAGAIPCCDPDPITGHWPHWLCVDEADPADKWHAEAFRHAGELSDGTYEIVGQHFRGNPYHLEKDVLVKHGTEVVEVERTFDGIRTFLNEHVIEGLVFWKDGEPMCKIKRTDFGLPWPEIGVELPEALQ